jgi:cell division protein FtsL
MEDNLARELELEKETVAVDGQYAPPVEQPYQEPAPAIEPIPKAEPVAKGLTKLEMALISVIGLIVFGLILLNVHTNLELATASRNVQDVNAQIAETEVEVENLEQQSHELSRYDRIHEIAQKYGLELHDENIVNIAPQE